MVHCHWELDLRSSIQLAQAVESIKPLWLEDPLPVDYTDSWKRLAASSTVPICTGENLTRREGFAQEHLQPRKPVLAGRLPQQQGCWSWPDDRGRSGYNLIVESIFLRTVLSIDI